MALYTLKYQTVDELSAHKLQDKALKGVLACG